MYCDLANFQSCQWNPKHFSESYSFELALRKFFRREFPIAKSTDRNTLNFNIMRILIKSLIHAKYSNV